MPNKEVSKRIYVHKKMYPFCLQKGNFTIKETKVYVGRGDSVMTKSLANKWNSLLRSANMYLYYFYMEHDKGREVLTVVWKIYGKTLNFFFKLNKNVAKAIQHNSWYMQLLVLMLVLRVVIV